MHCDEETPGSDPALNAATQRFRFLKQFNTEQPTCKVGSRDRLIPENARLFPGENLANSFARKLCEHRALPFNELLESYEFFACVRKRVRAKSMADLCCGHGLVGVLFAMFERGVERVVLIDKMQPASFERVIAAAADVTDWTVPKVEFVRCTLKNASRHLQPRTTVLGVHACGTRTDQCIDHAINVGGSVALLPCCHRKKHDSPECLKRVLGMDVAIDVDRTYRLDAAGYQMRWDRIPETITSKNRVITGVVKKVRNGS